VLRPKLDLELPSSSYSLAAGKSKKKKPSPSTITSHTVAATPSVNYTAKVKEKPKHIFAEKTVPVLSSTPMTSDSSVRMKTESGVESEVSFKKRKFSRPNARQPLD